MPEDYKQYITREEHNRSTDRLNQRIDPINDSSIRMEESSKRMETMVKEMHDLLYGERGITVRISNLFTKVAINRYLIGVVLVGIIGAALVIIRGGVK